VAGTAIEWMTTDLRLDLATEVPVPSARHHPGAGSRSASAGGLNTAMGDALDAVT
jgi:hypothetical protein